MFLLFTRRASYIFALRSLWSYTYCAQAFPLKNHFFIALRSLYSCTYCAQAFSRYATRLSAQACILYTLSNLNNAGVHFSCLKQAISSWNKSPYIKLTANPS